MSYNTKIHQHKRRILTINCIEISSMKNKCVKCLVCQEVDPRSIQYVC